MFSHLHVHSQYSKLDGMGTIEELLQRAKELGQPALAITDHGTCSGLYDLFTLAPQYGIKPIYGCEFYLNNGMEDKRNHIVLLAKDDEGLKHIYKLHEYSYVEGFKTRPTINMDVLKQYKTGLICMSACLANIIPRSVSEGREDIAMQWIKEFKRLFDDDFYLEVQDSIVPEQKIANRGLIKLGKQLGVNCVATNDVHYTLKADSDYHDTMLCMQINKKKHDKDRWRFPCSEYWLKSENEMVFDELDASDRLSALQTTMAIVDKCNATLTKGEYLPKYYDIPKGKTEEQLLREKVTARYKEEIQDKGYHTEQYVKDVMHELDVIEQTGYSGYHLIVSDFVEYSRKNRILVGDGRGSGSGCKVAYILGITRVEPNSHNLLFERFLDYGRQPDYDIDFADNNAIFEYLQSRYGIENVARIVAFGTLSAKAVSRKVFSAYGHPESLIAQVSGCIPAEPKMTLAKAYQISEQLGMFKKAYPVEFATMERLEGRISHTSQHAGGVIIYPNLAEHIPVHTDSDDRTKRIVSFDKKMAEDMGFCKIDCLGLEALTTLNQTINTIYDMEGIEVHLDTINYEDEAVYDDLCRGEIYGVFQLENQKDVVIKQQPRCFADIVALSSIIRPGTCDINDYFNRRNTKHYTIPDEQKWYMEESEGLIIYQEQYLLHCKTYAGWTIGFADKHVRKNKKIKEDEALARKFYSDCINNGYDKSFVEKLWEEIVSVAGGGYGFNKSHSVSYSIITYRNAWLKHYYPIHFYASLLTKLYNDDKKKHLLGNVIAECKAKGIKILPPDINNSLNQFIPTNEGIRYALTSVKGLGESALNHLMSLRPIASLEDMIARAERRYLRENVVDNLIKSGCFDDSNICTRYDILKSYKTLIKSKKEVIEKINMEYEYEALGIYLQKHPMDRFANKPLDDYEEGQKVVFVGMVKAVMEKPDKRGNKMAFITMENQYGSTQCLAFSSFWTDKERKKFGDNAVLMIKGSKSKSSVIINETKVVTM